MYTNISHFYCQFARLPSMKRSTIEQSERLLTSFHKIGAPIGNDCLKITINYKITTTGQNETSSVQSIIFMSEYIHPKR